MKISERLQGVARLFLDTAPIVYYVEKNPRYRYDPWRLQYGLRTFWC